MTDPTTSGTQRPTTARHSRVGSSVLSLAGGDMIARLAGFAGTVYLARVLGPEGFGILGFAFAFSGYIALAVEGGFSLFAAREVARRPGDAASFAASVVAVRLLLAMAAILSLAVITYFLPKPGLVKLVLLLTGLSYISRAINTGWVLKGLEQNHRVAISVVFSQVAYVGAVVLLVSNPRDVIWVPPAMFLGELLAALYLARYVFGGGNIKLDLRMGLRLVRRSSFLLVSRVMRVSLFGLDIVLLGFLASEQAVGTYAAVYRICNVLISINAAILFAYLPSFTRSAKESTSAVSETSGHSLAFSLAVGLPFVAGGVVVAEPLLSKLFGAAYADGAHALRLLLIGTGIMLIQNMIMNVMLAYKRLKVEMWILVAATTLNAGLNFLLIPRYGIVGAASATLAAEGLVLTLGAVVMYRIGVRPNVRPLWRILLAGAVMVTVILLVREHFSVSAHIVLGAIAYVSSLVILRAVPRHAQPDLSKLGGLFGDRRR